MAEKLADNIEFKPAETIQEARKFAHDNLGIYKYKLTDIDCANYVNEALCEYYNQSGNKRAIIDTIGNECNSSNIASISVFHSDLNINEEVLKNIDARIDSLFRNEESKNKVLKQGGVLDERFNLTQNQKERLEKYRKNPDGMSLKEKVGLMVFLQNASDTKLPKPTFYDALKNKEVKEYLNAKGLDNLDTICALPPQEGRELIKEIFENTSYKMTVPDGGNFMPVNHEIGHKEHAKNVGLEIFNLLATLQYDGSEDKSEVNMKLRKNMQKFMQNEPEWYVVCSAFPYGMASPAEFVAEAFACLVNGAELDDNIMRLYEKYGGVMP